MKKMFPCILTVLLLSFSNVDAAYIPLTITSGLNADVIANGVGTATATTSTTVDGASFVLVSNGWQQTATSTPCTTGLPANGIINSALTTGLSYQMAAYTGNNVLRMNTNTTATLTFQTAYNAQTLYLLAVTGSGTSTITVQTNFTDGTNQINTGIVVADWYGGTNVAYTGFQRLNRTTNALNSGTNGPNLYQYSIAINAANQGKLINGIQITRTASTSTSPTLNVMAVSIDQAAVITCAAPTSPTATGVTSTTASLNWNQTGTPISYQIKYGTSGFNVNTGGTSIFTATKPYTLNPPLTPSTSYNYYVRAICTAGDTSTWSAVTNFTTLCNAPAMPSKKDSFNCGPGTVTLEATSSTGASLKWYSTAMGGTSIGAGNSFTTPSLTATTNFYVEAVQLSSIGQTGRNDYTGIAQATPNNTGQGIRFNTLSNINLDSVGVWVVSDTGKIIVQLQNAANTILKTDTFTFAGIGATATSRVKIYLPVNYSIPTGNDYKILALNGTTVSLSREQSINPTFANYSIPNVITMVSSWVNGATNAANYYYFYNFYVSSGCASPRETVVATIRPVPVVNLGNDTTLCPGVSLTLNAGNAGGTYLWSPGGQTTQTITTNAVGQYIADVTVNGCSKKDTIAITPGIAPVNNLPDTTNLCEGSETTLNAGNTGSTFFWIPGNATTQTITVDSGGTRSVEIKSAHHCKLTSSTYVNMRPLPVDNLGNDTSICSSASVVLDAGNSGYSYLWNTGATSQTINASDSGTYFVTITTPYSCVNSDTTHIAYLPPPRTEGFNFIPKFYEELGRVEFSPLNPTNVNGYEWNFGDGSPLVLAINPTHVFAASGEYNVTLRVYNDCSEYAVSQKINVDLPTGTVTINKENFKLNIYPNPAKSVLNISNTNADYKMKDVMVFNALGAMVYRHKADSETIHQLSVESFSTGIYFVRVLTNKGFVNQQVQIVR
ncbi:Ig-like domain-containing protein [Taibaiella lutea]|nr:T9SS type A sorting domain-containing protein [Taibaiella lutea]